MNYSSVQKVLKVTMKWRAWKPQFIQKLYPDDHDRREEFSDQMLDWMETWPELLDNILWTDEAVFHIGGFINRHNSHYWALENPNQTVEKSLHSPKVTVWCGITSSAVVGPFFIRDTVNGERYLELLKSKVFPVISTWNNSQLLFMQDGAPPHFARNVRDWLNENFSMRWIGRRGPVEWPPRSPDLTPMDFFLWGYIKDIVYRKKLEKLEELEEAIQEAIAAIPPDMLMRAVHSVQHRLEKCRDQNGTQVELE